MSNGLRYTTFKTEKGWIGLLGSPLGLRRATLPQTSGETARLQLGTTAAIHSPDTFREFIRLYAAYFRGDCVIFPDALDLTGATAWQQAVWRATRDIAYGETISYGQVAYLAGKPGAARAVGQALACNPLPIIIPCHRVLGNNRILGGYSGGLQMKRYLLSLEGAVFRE